MFDFYLSSNFEVRRSCESCAVRFGEAELIQNRARSALWLSVQSRVFLFLFASVFFLFLPRYQKEKENRSHKQTL